MSWEVNPGLAPLVLQEKKTHPGIVIGTIGDAAHKHEVSDHNPNAAGRVNAADFMLGPHFTEADALALVGFLILDPRTKYVIHDGRIWKDPTGHSAAEAGWHPYHGSDPHTNHVHLSVWDAARFSTGPWTITTRVPTMINLGGYVVPELKRGDDDNTHDGYDMVRRAQKLLNLKVDGVYGPVTAAAVRKLNLPGRDGSIIDLPVWALLYGLVHTG